MPPNGGFFRGCPKGQFHHEKIMITYNSFQHSCQNDLASYGDHTGMLTCFQELGLSPQHDAEYSRHIEPEALEVLEVI